MSDNSEFPSKTLRGKVGHMRSFIDRIRPTWHEGDVALKQLLLTTEQMGHKAWSKRI
jgi:hypothetical protein